MSIRLFIAMMICVSAPVLVSAEAEPSANARSIFQDAPRGPWPVGTVQTYIRASPLDVRAAPEDRITLQIWYPAAAYVAAEYAPYILTPEQYFPSQDDDGGMMQWAQAAQHLVTGSLRDAPVANGPSFPVILYSHGGGYPQFIGTFLTEFLASHGYVVVAVGHPGWDGLHYQQFPDGVIRRDSDPVIFRAAPPRGNLSAEIYYQRLWTGEAGLYGSGIRQMGERLSQTLDYLEQAAAEEGNAFYQRLDLSKVGTVGWSLGGAASMQITVSDPRVRAAVNMDGWPYGMTGEAGVIAAGAPVPMLLITSKTILPSGRVSLNAAEEVANQVAEMQMWKLFAQSKTDWYWLRIHGGSHADYSDLVLFQASSDDGKDAWLAARTVHQIITEHVLEFFNRHLRKHTNTPLLAGERLLSGATLLQNDTWRALPSPGFDRRSE